MHRPVRRHRQRRFQRTPRRPQLILELRANPIAADEEKKELAVWQQLQSVPAVTNGRVYIIADPRTVIPGPRVVEGIEALAARIRQTR